MRPIRPNSRKLISPLEQIQILSQEVQELRQQIKISNHLGSDSDLTELCLISELSDRFGETELSMRNRLRKAGGKVFKFGKNWVIRRVVLIAVLEKLEAN